MLLLSLIGPPCVGKGTQSRILQTELGFTLIGAGDLLRAKAKTDSECAKMVREGQLVPVEYIWNLLEQEIDKSLQAGKSRILLDGYPRELDQAKVLDKYLKSKQLILNVFNMHAGVDLLFERMMNRVYCPNCGATASKPQICCKQQMIKRLDDNEESFKTRLEIFFSNVDKVKDFYADKDTCRWFDVDAALSIEEMNKQFDDILCKIGL